MTSRCVVCGVLGVLLLAVAAAPTAAEEMITVVGTVTDDYLIIDDDGAVYVISDVEKGQELLGYVGSRVKATGKVQEDVDGPMIEVKRFEVISD